MRCKLCVCVWVWVWVWVCVWWEQVLNMPLPLILFIIRHVIKGTLCNFLLWLNLILHSNKDCSLAPHIFKCVLQPVETMAGGMCQDSRSYDNNMSCMPRGAFCPSGQSIDRKNMAASIELTRPM